MIDPVIEALVSAEGINNERLYELAYSLTTESPDREPVKFGIAILGLFDPAANQELFQTLGRHDEFTLFCAVSLSNVNEDSDEVLWKLARTVDGWGRIHVVERLAQTENSEIKEWLLREGYRNSVMYEYLAFTCATAGGLLSALSEDQVDREMLTSAGEIIQALICGGPAESIDDYDDGALVVEMYLRHMEPSANTLTDFLNVNIIKTFLTEAEADWESRSEQGWTSQRRSELSAACDEILSLPVWVERVQLALVSQDEMEFHQADQTAKALGIDTWEHHWRKLQEKPTDSGCWYHVMAMVDDDRLPQVIAAAENWIDLAGIATGASDEMGMGPDYEPHSCLDCVLQELRRFPGHGAMFIEAGLKSPVVRNRNMAVAALADWGQDVWTSPTHESLKMAAKAEPEDEVKERMQKVLNGESLED